MAFDLASWHFVRKSTQHLEKLYRNLGNYLYVPQNKALKHRLTFGGGHAGILQFCMIKAHVSPRALQKNGTVEIDTSGTASDFVNAELTIKDQEQASRDLNTNLNVSLEGNFLPSLTGDPSSAMEVPQKCGITKTSCLGLSGA